jgi:hypothetical protein
LWLRDGFDGTLIGCEDFLVEAGEDHLFDGGVFVQCFHCFTVRDLNSLLDGVAVNAATDGWEG